MGKFIFTLICVAVVNGVIGILSPEGDLKKYVRFAGALCILLVMAVPIHTFAVNNGFELDGLSLGGEFDAEDYESIYEKALYDGGKETAENTLKEMLRAKFGMSSDGFDVEIDVSAREDGYSIESVTVILHSSVIFTDHRDITAYVNENLGCGCKVKYG